MNTLKNKYIYEKHKVAILLQQEKLKTNTEIPNLLFKLNFGKIRIDFNDMIKNYSVTHFEMAKQTVICDWNVEQSGNIYYFLNDIILEATPYNSKAEKLFCRYGNYSDSIFTFRLDAQYSASEPHIIVNNLDVRTSPFVLLASPTDAFQLLIQFLTPISTQNQPSKLSLLRSVRKAKKIIQSYRLFRFPIYFEKSIIQSIDVNLAVGSVDDKTYHFSINEFTLSDTTCDLNTLIHKIYNHLLRSSGNIVYKYYYLDYKFIIICYFSFSFSCFFIKLF